MSIIPRRLLQVKLKTIRRKLLRFFSILSIGLVYNEFLVYYFVLCMCTYPPALDSPPKTPVMILADTHLLGSRLGHWADKLRREWQMHRTFQAAQTLFAPSHIFFLGDLFDEGKWCPPEEFDYYVRRFHSLFPVDPHHTTIHVMAGNHDIGFHYAVTPYLDSRFKEAFQTESVQLKFLDDKIPIVLINSVAFEGDSCFLCKSTSNRLDKVVESLKKWNSRPILMSHYPLYRRSDGHCDEVDEAPAAEKNQLFKEGWDCLTKNASRDLLTKLRPRLVLSGHTHHGCTTSHGGTVEISVSSFSWRNKKNPAFYLGYFTNNDSRLSKCFMPNENTLFTSYIFFLSFSLFSLFIN